MQRLHHIFQRAALALALLTSGLGGGYVLHDPAAAHIQPCQAAGAAKPDTPAAVYATPRASSGVHSACSCGNA